MLYDLLEEAVDKQFEQKTREPVVTHGRGRTDSKSRKQGRRGNGRKATDAQLSLDLSPDLPPVVGRIDLVDPASLTPEKRLRELAAVFARGVPHLNGRRAIEADLLGSLSGQGDFAVVQRYWGAHGANPVSVGTNRSCGT